MTVDYFDLNENVMYIVETFNYIERNNGIKLSQLGKNDQSFEIVKQTINLSIKICLCKSNKSDKNKIKNEIFSYLMWKFFKIKTIVPSTDLSFDLIMFLIIENQLEDLVKV